MVQPSARIALLIDSDNVSAKHIGGILAELASHGTTSVRRMYGDFTTDNLRGWKTAANEYSIQPMQQYAYTAHKNSTDSALIIDAMDLLHQGHLDAFAIVSSDSDFTRLAARIRESGATVFGFGARITPKPFVSACDMFTFLDVLVTDASDQPTDAKPTGATTVKPATKAAGTTKAGAKAGGTKSTETATKAKQVAATDDVTTPPKRATTKELRGDTRLMNLLRAGIMACADDDGWANLGPVGSTIRKQAPEFDSRNWGYAKLGDLMKTVGLFDVETFLTSNGHTSLRARIKTKKK